MNIFKSIAISLSIIVGLGTTSTFGMKRATPTSGTQETHAPSAQEDCSTPAIKQTCGEYRDPHAKKEKNPEAQQLPVTQDDEEDTDMVDEPDNEAIAEITKELAATGFFQPTRFRFVNRVATALATKIAMNIVRIGLKDLNEDLKAMQFDISDDKDRL